jgi:dynactin complex subunit
MKYKCLTTEELKELQPEFVHFLAAAQITGPDWDEMKRNEASKAEELIEVFSDMVYDKVVSKIKFLEYREKKTLNIFNCTDEGITLVGIRVNEHSSLDLTADNVFTQWTESNNSAVNVIKTERPYQKERGVEVFELLQSGCLITDDRLFNVLKEMIN